MEIDNITLYNPVIPSLVIRKQGKIMVTNGTTNGYVIAVDKIVDMERFTTEYLPTAAETIQNHEGKILVSSFDPQVVEGEWDHTLTAVIEFPSLEAAEEWYNDETYQEVKQIRHDTCSYTNMVIEPEFTPEDLE